MWSGSPATRLKWKQSLLDLVKIRAYLTEELETETCWEGKWWHLVPQIEGAGCFLLWRVFEQNLRMLVPRFHALIHSRTCFFIHDGSATGRSVYKAIWTQNCLDKTVCFKLACQLFKRTRPCLEFRHLSENLRRSNFWKIIFLDDDPVKVTIQHL